MVRRRSSRWRRSCDWLPGDQRHTLFETAAVPLVEILAFERPAAIERLDTILIATIRAGGQPVLLMVAPWGDRLDPLWRVAVTQAMRRSAAWTLLFNGTHLRIVDAGRLYARRFDFDVDLAIDDERTCEAFWWLLHAAAFSAAAGTIARRCTRRRGVRTPCVGRLQIVARWRPCRFGRRARRLASPCRTTA